MLCGFVAMVSKAKDKKKITFKRTFASFWVMEKFAFTGNKYPFWKKIIFSQRKLIGSNTLFNKMILSFHYNLKSLSWNFVICFNGCAIRKMKTTVTVTSLEIRTIWIFGSIFQWILFICSTCISNDSNPSENEKEENKCIVHVHATYMYFKTSYIVTITVTVLAK